MAKKVRVKRGKQNLPIWLVISCVTMLLFIVIGFLAPIINDTGASYSDAVGTAKETAAIQGVQHE